jgi:GTP:adenosylcobinamide-phosphate guanylyltransferase
MDAVVLAGDRSKNRKVLGIEKAFLILAGRPLLLHVLTALDGARSIDRIYVIGPKERIESLLALFSERTKPWIVLEQQETLLANALSAYGSAWAENVCAGDHPASPRAASPRASATEAEPPPALFVPADVPLLTSHEIEAFIARSDMGRADYCIGMTREEALTRFYPETDRPGVRMAYLHTQEGAYRMNNLHLVRPRKVGAVDVIQTAYNLRHQREIGNTLQTLRNIIRGIPLSQGLLLYALARCAVWFSKLGITPLVSACRRRLPVAKVERLLSRLLKTRVALVETPFGGGAIDVDDDAAYATLTSRHAEWYKWLSQSDGKIDRGVEPVYPHPFSHPSLR